MLTALARNAARSLEDAGVDRIQFDVMDGNFVPNLTFGPELIAADNAAHDREYNRLRNHFHKCHNRDADVVT